MKSLLKFFKLLNSTTGVLFLVVCWMVTFIIFIGFSELEDTESRFKDLFIPETFQNSIKNFDSPANKNRVEPTKLLNLLRKHFEKFNSEDFNKIKEIVPDNKQIESSLQNDFQKIYPKPPEVLDLPEQKNDSNGLTTKETSKTIFKNKLADQENVTLSRNSLQQTVENATERTISEEEVKIKNSSFKIEENEFTIYPRLNDPNAPGEGGRPFRINKDELTESEKAEYKSGWEKHQFNLYASDRISVRRSIPDQRSKECKEMKFLENLPTTSIVIVFHNEAWSTLLRTIHSIIDRSPGHLLKEIVLVDDASTFEHLKSRLNDYVKPLKIVKIVRSETRVGLMKARIIGAEETSGEVLTFLDAHIECYPGWLEPMLERIAENNRTVVCPIIESINDNTFEASNLGQNTISVGVFDWKMQFNWQFADTINIQRLTRESPVKYPPHIYHDEMYINLERSPAMAGGLFSIMRTYFYELGTYDPGMKIWGSENVEMSLRIWMCGGILEIIPCSHVGHVFRSRSPYSWGESIDKILTINQRRLVEVWLDEYKEVYYSLTGNRDRYDIGNIQGRMKLRRKLKCHSFQWYLKNVFPSLYDPLSSKFMGSIESFASKGNCLDSGNENSRTVKLFPCHNLGGNQLFLISQTGFLRTINKCFSQNKLLLNTCDKDPVESRWKYDDETNLIYDKQNNCVAINTNENVEVQTCSFEVPSIEQKWHLKSFVTFKLPYDGSQDDQ